jgi:predicted HTH domain antitoxin
MHLTLSDDVVLSANLSEADLRLALALALFQDGRITLAQGARLASLDRLAFQHQLATRKLQIHYGEEELDSDMRTIESL